jgi:hypothetical protein
VTFKPPVRIALFATLFIYVLVAPAAGNAGGGKGGGARTSNPPRVIVDNT